MWVVVKNLAGGKSSPCISELGGVSPVCYHSCIIITIVGGLKSRKRYPNEASKHKTNATTITLHAFSFDTVSLLRCFSPVLLEGDCSV